MEFRAGQTKQDFNCLVLLGGGRTTLDLVRYWGSRKLCNSHLKHFIIPSHTFSLIWKCRFDFQTCRHTTQDNFITLIDVQSPKNWSLAVLHPQMLTTSKVDLPPAGCPEKNPELIVRYLWSRLYKQLKYKMNQHFPTAPTASYKALSHERKCLNFGRCLYIYWMLIFEHKHTNVLYASISLIQLHISTLFASQVIPWSSVHDHVNSPLKPTIPHKLWILWLVY